MAEGAFDALLDGYRAFEAEGRYRPGYVAPVLNVNGFSYVTFLETLGLAEEYAERFGELRRAVTGVRIHHDPEAARWIWERSLPFDAVARRFTELPYACEPIPHQFSIGMILFERSLWEEMHGLKAARRPPGVGTEEIALGRFCVDALPGDGRGAERLRRPLRVRPAGGRDARRAPVARGGTRPAG